MRWRINEAVLVEHLRTQSSNLGNQEREHIFPVALVDDESDDIQGASPDIDQGMQSALTLGGLHIACDLGDEFRQHVKAMQSGRHGAGRGDELHPRRSAAAGR